MPEKLALFGGLPVRSNAYYPNKLGEEEKRLALSVLDEGVLSGFAAKADEQFYGGKYVRELEVLFCRRFGAKYAVSFNSATSGLHGALLAAGVGPGDEVIVPPYTMSATATAVLMCHAVPVFVDIEPNMFCMNPALIESHITKNTKAIIPVHLFGLPAEMDSIMEIAECHKLIVIEDNAQASGAFYKGHPTGAIGHMGVFSLNRHKNIHCGEGGVVLSKDPDLTERLQLCRNHGELVLFLKKGNNKNDDIVGYNYRLSELHAAVAIGQLKRIDELNNTRSYLSNYLTERLSEIPYISSPKIREGCTHVYFLYPMLYNREKLGIHRDTLVKAIVSEGVHASNYAAPIYMYPIYKGINKKADNFKKVFPEYEGCPNYKDGICPETERLYNDKMLFTNICRSPNTVSEVDELIATLKKIEANKEVLLDFEK